MAAFVVGAVMSQTTMTNFTPKCMDCICQIESNCRTTIGCIMDSGSLSCGPYQIKEPVSLILELICTHFLNDFSWLNLK